MRTAEAVAAKDSGPRRGRETVRTSPTCGTRGGQCGGRGHAIHAVEAAVRQKETAGDRLHAREEPARPSEWPGDASLGCGESLGWGCLRHRGWRIASKRATKKTRRPHEQDPRVAHPTRVAPAVVTDGAATQPHGRWRAKRRAHASPAAPPTAPRGATPPPSWLLQSLASPRASPQRPTPSPLPISCCSRAQKIKKNSG